MKTRVASTILFCVLALALLPGISAAQSITINSVSGTKFCAGDPVSVSFTVTGLWGHRNAFVLQLSDSAGSFSTSFQNVGSFADTLPGTFTIDTTIPVSVSSSSRYRFRILGSIPYFTSSDNDSDIAIGTRPSTFSLHASDALPSGSTGIPITFTAQSGFLGLTDTYDAQDTGFWDFGSGANPAGATTNAIVSSFAVSFSHDVTYSTPGDKTVTLTIVKPGGCSGSTLTYNFHIYDCSTPSIPQDAIVVDSGGISVQTRRTYWVDPGFTFYYANGDTVFAEPGSTISGNGSNCVLYLKPGAVLSPGRGSSSNSVIYADGASIKTGTNDFTLNCPTLNFDYTNAPPNAALPNSAVDRNQAATAISIMPNPTNSSISITGIPQNVIRISVLSVLGMVEKNIQKPNASDLQVNLGTLPAGVYYIRFEMPGRVVTRRIVKE